MTVRYLLWFRCRVCNKDFLSYCFGRFISQMRDCNHEDGICFYDNKLGEIHDNHIFNPIRDSERKCQRCNKSAQLEDFI